ncbi:MAG: polysaccharide deacetylase family protein [Candidatus Levyibacteriota bacterium]
MEKKERASNSISRFSPEVPPVFQPIALILLGLALFFFNTISPVTRETNARIEAFEPAVLLLHLISSVSPVLNVMPPEDYKGYCLNVPVIFYHHIQPMAEARAKGKERLTVDNGIFVSQMSYLYAKGYRSISASQLASALIAKSKLPAKSIVISFDDGYEDFYTYAYPILQKYHFVASLAIPTGLLGRNGYLSWDELKEMDRSGKIFIYSHTKSHTNLTKVTVSKAQYEILAAKEQLQKFTGKNSNVFFYPYGAVSFGVISVLDANGYQAGYSTKPGFIQCDSFLMALHRTEIGNLSLSSYGL